MIAIIDERFEPPLGFQTSGGPVWKTEIVTLASGGETRNALWAQPLRKWQVTGVPLSRADAQALVRFFNARSGAHQGFLFADPFGAASGEPLTALDQPLGVGDGIETRFQLTLDEGGSVPRRITRPVAGRVMVAVNGVEVAGFALDGGEVVFDTPPGAGDVLTAGFEYDLPVRFETDMLDLSQTSTGAYQLVRLSLLEVREGT